MPDTQICLPVAVPRKAPLEAPEFEAPEFEAPATR